MPDIELLEAEASAVAQPNYRRVNLEFIESRIVGTEYYHAPPLTIAIVTHQNGFKAVGQSASADPKNYNRELGDKAARSRAIEQLWMVEGFLLCEQMHQSVNQ